MASSLNDPSLWLSKELFLAYLGVDASSGYAAFYDKAVAKRKMMVGSLNGLALLLFPAWLGYRRQTSLFVVYAGLFGLLPIVERILKIDLPRGAFVGVGIGLGLYAHSFLLMNAQGLYLKLKGQGLPAEEIGARMRGKAAASRPLAVAALALFFVVCTLGVLAAEIGRGPPPEDEGPLQQVEVRGD